MAIDTQKHLYDLIKDFGTAMLVTRDAAGMLRSRPMAIAELQRDADAYFATQISSPKMDDVRADSHVLVTFQSSTQFASIEGTAEIVTDRAEIDRLWSDTWKIWFPGGKDDPTLCLLKVNARSGEYWDNAGMNGISYLFESVKAVVQGREPTETEAQHAKVRL